MSFVFQEMAEQGGDEDRRRVEMRPSTSRGYAGQPEEPSDLTAGGDWLEPPPVQRTAGCHLRQAAGEHLQAAAEQVTPERKPRDLRVALTPLEEEYQVVELPYCLAEQERLAEHERQAPPVNEPEDKPWTQCPACGAWYTKPANMRRHHRSVHEGIRVRCPQCEVSFTRQDSLTQHLARFH